MRGRKSTIFVRPLMGAVLSLSALLACAHSEGEGPDRGMLDCTHPGAEVATALPEAIASPAHLECTPAFQQIVANQGWTWRYPGSYFERPFIPAYAPRSSQGLGGSRFFTGFEARELSPEEIRDQHERFVRTLPTYREASAPARVLKIVATNDLGHELNAFFGFRSDHDGWVVTCTPECAPENLFLIEKVE
jgi:hypothetical protein